MARHADQAVDVQLLVAMHCCVLNPAAAGCAVQRHNVIIAVDMVAVRSGVVEGEVSHLWRR
jgi:hypothetical protein